MIIMRYLTEIKGIHLPLTETMNEKRSSDMFNEYIQKYQNYSYDKGYHFFL